MISGGESTVMGKLACALHPELTGDDTAHRYFLDMVRRRGGSRA